MIYLDYNATAPMKPAVRAAIVEAMERTGNPSSVHRYGRVARRYVEEARAHVAALVGARPAQVVFTSGGTEANALALAGLAARGPLWVSAIEHDSVLACVPEARRLPVTPDGVLDLEEAARQLAEAPAGGVVALMVVNNETGVIQPVAELAALARRYGHGVHADAAQAAGKIPLDCAALGVRSLALSAHKLGGPPGAGALVLAEGVEIEPLLRGGGQERGRRAGTENAPALVGFGVAAQLAADDLRLTPQFRAWQAAFESRLLAAGGEDLEIPGRRAPRVATTTALALRGVSGRTQAMAMDLDGVAVSAGAACSSGTVKESHVLRAMGLDSFGEGAALRVSFGWATRESDLARCAEVWENALRRFRESAPPSQGAPPSREAA